eukprot:CAMPEP_0179238868 /NCGR_PEP_ID=MMETSP0797-20121207/15172_1 /TAXON_ID=47934 /ORGANISM="Dinophysis acuminata, Strain DAEP01" /LENGTH=193 /DNA_ID=CAMNT_0020946183 /DNA_START=1007 /DNA_END=1588 /DNA_ORIENTATION=+
MNLALGDDLLGTWVDDAKLLVLARCCQQGPVVIPLQAHHLLRQVDAVGDVLLREVPDLAGQVEGRTGDDVLSGRVESAENDLFAVPLERDQGLFQVLLEALVGHVPRLYGQVFACTDEHVLVKGVELEVQDWRRVPDDQGYVAWGAAVPGHRDHGKRATTPRVPREAKQLRVSADACRFSRFAGKPKVLVLLL